MTAGEYEGSPQYSCDELPVLNAEAGVTWWSRHQRSCTKAIYSERSGTSWQAVMAIVNTLPPQSQTRVCEQSACEWTTWKSLHDSGLETPDPNLVSGTMALMLTHECMNDSGHNEQFKQFRCVKCPGNQCYFGHFHRSVLFNVIVSSGWEDGAC